MKKGKDLFTENLGKKPREPISNTNLLMTITICTFIGMYMIAMLVWGGGFLNPQQFLDLFNNNAFLVIIACGLTMIMISGGIDISGGGVTALVTMACVVYLEDHGGTVAGSILLALGIGLFFGLLHGILVAYLEIQPFIVTLAGMFFARGMVTIVSIAPRTASHEAFLNLKQMRITIPGLGYYGKTGIFIPAQIELGVVIALIVVIAVAIILKWTRFGRNLYAVGGNSHSALTLGINVKRTKFYAYLLAGILSGIGGYVYLLHTGAGDAANATQAEMQAIASNIIGGTLLTGGVGNVIGTLFGMLSLKTITNIVIASGLTKPYYQSITTGLMLCFFILLQSVILAVREKGAIGLLPEWLRPGKKDKNQS
ncbi:MAG: sugar ABC transporter permease YjfF [Clostridiaceae bacterium]|jgi:ribose/xylose/arabinose/galactoside ABC-type transport system permease subunit|nr:sugar ABC transporter permease YjfF [Clostridiaceae bacterium]